MAEDGLEAAEAKMREAGQPEEAIRSFPSAYRRLESGESAMLPSAELEPAGDVDALEQLPDADAGALDRVAVIKLNGGLATTMGLRSPEVAGRGARRAVVPGHHRRPDAGAARRYGVRLPLVLMNSEATQRDTLRGARAASRARHRPARRTSSRAWIPKLDAETLAPVSWPPEPSLEWCPPGHGDVYGALRRSGMLDALLEQRLPLRDDLQRRQPRARRSTRGSPRTCERSEIPFLMEVVEGTEADRKGGHIARRRADGQLVLRETAQTPPEDEESFRDYRHWRYYNTNSLWVDLRVLAEMLEESDGVLELPLIINRKTVDPRDPSSPPVIQLESAMGAAIGSFKGAQLLCVPRTRFVPVKTTDDLLVLRSDVYTLSEDMLVVAGARARRGPALRRARQGVLQAARRLRAAVSRRARRRCARPSGWSCTATSRSARRARARRGRARAPRSRGGSTPGRRSARCSAARLGVSGQLVERECALSSAIPLMRVGGCTRPASLGGLSRSTRTRFAVAGRRRGRALPLDASSRRATFAADEGGAAIAAKREVLERLLWPRSDRGPAGGHSCRCATRSRPDDGLVSSSTFVAGRCSGG